MKTLFLIIIFTNVFLLGQSIDSTKVKSPEFTFITIAGDTVKSKELKGKVILLDFWNSGCIPCRKSFPTLEKVYHEYKERPEVAIFIVNSGWESLEKARKFLKKRWHHKPLFSKREFRWNLPFAYDNNSITFNSLGLNGNPSTIIIDKNFIIRKKKIGTEVEIDLYTYLTDVIDKLILEENK
jgi:thiol-disulfide isomerase/thioredoxin